MKIALIGYGKMGHMVEAQAKRLGHEIALIADPFAADAACHAAGDDLAKVVCESGAEGAIEFSRPDAAPGNIRALLPLQLPLVVGTTGWAAEEPAIAALAATTGGTLVRSANFSLGVNLFYRIVSEAARIMAELGGDEYDEAVWEAHHNQKADSPLGDGAGNRPPRAGSGRPQNRNRGGQLRRNTPAPPAPSSKPPGGHRAGNAHRLF